MEVIDIGLDDLDSALGMGKGEDSSVNFGSGIELLMNEKNKVSNAKTNIGLDELDNLENELNELSGANGNSSSDTKNIGLGSSGAGFSSFFNFGSKKEPSQKQQYQPSESDSNIGHATAESVSSNAKTWDGFTKLSGAEVPTESASAKLTDREKRRKKRLMIKKLDEWYEKGLLKHSSHFNMDSNFDEVEDEYESALEDKRKKDSVKLQGWWFTTVINTLEYGNAFLNPFDLNLDGWGEQVSEDLDSYEEIFGELHEKYKGGKMAPEVSLLLRIGFSAAVVNMSNKMLSSATPGVSDIMKQSPELMRMFTNTAVDMMSKQSPTFDFAKNMMNPPEQVNTKFGPPPASVETKNMGNMANRPGMSAPVAPAGSSMQFTRPDLAAGRGGPMFREGGIDVNERSSFNPPPPMQQQPKSRPEMRGPQTTDIDHLLSGLKTKPQASQQPQYDDMSMAGGDDSMISMTSLKDLNSSSLPKKTKKRQNTSNKNTIALDI